MVQLIWLIIAFFFFVISDGSLHIKNVSLGIRVVDLMQLPQASWLQRSEGPIVSVNYSAAFVCLDKTNALKKKLWILINFLGVKQNETETNIGPVTCHGAWETLTAICLKDLALGLVVIRIAIPVINDWRALSWILFYVLARKKNSLFRLEFGHHKSYWDRIQGSI